MLIFPAIDIFDGKVVRLYKGDYKQMTVYSDDPLKTALDFKRQGAAFLHMVDLQGAKDGTTPNIETVKAVASGASMFTEIGGGIRDMEVVERYLSAGVDRVIIGTAAVTDPEFVRRAAASYGERIAVGVDLRDGFVSINGWTKDTRLTAVDFCKKMRSFGVRTIICTDISRDGTLAGSNHDLYGELISSLDMDIIASGGVSSIEDVKALKSMGLHGAIIGKAYYSGKISLKDAIEVAK